MADTLVKILGERILDVKNNPQTSTVFAELVESSKQQASKM